MGLSRLHESGVQAVEVEVFENSAQSACYRGGVPASEERLKEEESRRPAGRPRRCAINSEGECSGEN